MVSVACLCGAGRQATGRFQNFGSTLNRNCGSGAKIIEMIGKIEDDGANGNTIRGGVSIIHSYKSATRLLPGFPICEPSAQDQEAMRHAFFAEGGRDGP